MALKLAGLGVYIFPVDVKPKSDNPYRTTKKPLTKNGFKDATTDTDQIRKWWTEHPKAFPGVAMGPSGLMAIDFDIKRLPSGNIEIDGMDNWSKEFLDLPTTFSFKSVSNSGGEQYVYLAPKGVTLAPSTNYRDIEGVDIRAGGSYSVFTDAPDSFDEFSPAPEWACDARVARDLSQYDGTVQDWFKELEPGAPSLPVRNAIAKVEETFVKQKEDLTHAQIIEFQHNAIRLGAEGHPGVEGLLERIKELTLARKGEHSRDPDEYEHEFMEALVSGIAKHGDAIELRKKMPSYSVNLIPLGTPERFIIGEPGDKALFTEVLRDLVGREKDDLIVLSVLWSLPTTKDLAREWGLEFVYKRITDSRKNPEPVGENPILEARALDTTYIALLSHEEKEEIRKYPTFIDQYFEVSKRKGYNNDYYDTVAAWTLLSMALGGRGILPMGKPFGLNLWFIGLGTSGSGKTTALKLLEDCLDLMLKDGETYYNLGANSSPEGMHERSLERDKKNSMILHDEASDFFENLKRKDWMSGLKDQLSKWYEGKVDPVQKVRLKELKGKFATTSFNISMLATPDRLLGLVDTAMFETGFLARFNWEWDPKKEEYDESKYLVSRTEVTDEGINPGAYELVADLLFARKALPPSLVAMNWCDDAELRLMKAHRRMDEIARSRDKYTATEPSVTRLKETAWKCAALLALWRGDDTIRDIDAMTSLLYVERWFNTLFRIVNAAGEGDFNRDANEIEAFIGSKKDGVSQAALYTRFRSMIQKSPRELDDRITFLLTSGRIVRDTKTSRYTVNGVKGE